MNVNVEKKLFQRRQGKKVPEKLINLSNGLIEPEMDTVTRRIINSNSENSKYHDAIEISFIEHKSDNANCKRYIYQSTVSHSGGEEHIKYSDLRTCSPKKHDYFLDCLCNLNL